jgi:hypothetical protein
MLGHMRPLCAGGYVIATTSTASCWEVKGPIVVGVEGLDAGLAVSQLSAPIRHPAGFTSPTRVAGRRRSTADCIRISNRSD